MDLINTRTRAMQRNRMHFVDLTTTQYTIYEDTNTAPNGDGISNPAADTQVSQKHFRNTLSDLYGLSPQSTELSLI